MQSDKLNIKHLSKDSFSNLLRHIIDKIQIKEVFFSRKNFAFKDSQNPISPNPRIDICLSGRKHIKFPGEDQICEVFMKPGQIHYCPPLHWKHPVWDSNHEMSSIIYTPDFIRITYIDFNEDAPMCNSEAASVFYHTFSPIGEAGKQILNVLDVLSVKECDNTVRCLLIKALLKLTLQKLETDTHPTLSKSDLTWKNINHYIRENFYYPINRAHVAKEFGLHPSYISRLFTDKGNENFNGALCRLRMEYASLLLKNTNMTIGEITDRCGYLSSTSLIGTFKKYFGMPPGKYRLINQ